MANNRMDDDFDDDLDNQPEIQKGFSAVAVMPGRNILIIAAIIISALILVYYTFFSSSDADKEKPKPPPSEVSSKIDTIKPVSAEPVVAAPAVAPTLPEPPPLVVPTPPPPPPPPPAPPPPIAEIPAPAITPFVADRSTDAKESLQARRKSGIMYGAGGSGAMGEAGGKKGLLDGIGGADSKKTASKSAGNPYFIPDQTTAQQQDATQIGHTNYIVAQGKVIDAVLETAINTDLQGILRAIVSRDIYAESGRRILIPKGSRLIGVYKSDIKRGQQRVDIVWNRIIRPDGLDIMVGSPGIDQLGRSGAEGDVDNKYIEMFTNAVLLSTVTTGFAIIAENLTKKKNQPAPSTTTVIDPVTGGTVKTTDASATNVAIADATQSIGNVGKDIIRDYMKINPTITVNQGTRVKVFVNRDLIFPENFGSGLRVVQ